MTKKILLCILSAMFLKNAYASQESSCALYSDHLAGHMFSTQEFGFMGVGNLNICGKPGSATLFGNIVDGRPTIVVSPVYRLEELIAFFNEVTVKEALNDHISRMSTVIRNAIEAINPEIPTDKPLSKKELEQAVALLDKDMIDSINHKMENISNSMKETLIELGRQYGLEELGISGWQVEMSQSKIFPKGIKGPRFNYESDKDFTSRLYKGLDVMFSPNPDIVTFQEVCRGGGRSSKPEQVFSEIQTRYTQYAWLAPVSQLPESEGSMAMTAYKHETYADVSKETVAVGLIKKILMKLFFSKDQEDKVFVAALKHLESGKIVYVCNVHGDYTMANKEGSAIYRALRTLLDTLPGLVFGADINAQVAKQAEIESVFTGFAGQFSTWGTPEKQEKGGNPTLDILAQSKGFLGEEALAGDIIDRLSALLGEVTELNTQLNAK
jgi:hypothetical protein